MTDHRVPIIEHYADLNGSDDGTVLAQTALAAADAADLAHGIVRLEARDRYDRKAMVHVVVYHQRHSGGSCMCGFSKLGRSQAEHVADMYEQVVAGTYRPWHVEEITYTWPEYLRGRA